jgi:hypothetical protein
MSDKCHVLHVLYPHHADQVAAFLVSPKHHTIGDLTPELIPGHVGLSPQVSRDHAGIGRSGIVDDLVDDFEVSVIATSDHHISFASDDTDSLVG